MQEPIKLCGLKSDRAVSLIRGVQSRTLKFGIGISLGLWALNGFSAAHAKGEYSISQQLCIHCFAEQNVPQEGAQPGVYKEGLPLFTKEDVAKVCMYLPLNYTSRSLSPYINMEAPYSREPNMGELW